MTNRGYNARRLFDMMCLSALLCPAHGIILSTIPAFNEALTLKPMLPNLELISIFIYAYEAIGAKHVDYGV